MRLAFGENMDVPVHVNTIATDDDRWEQKKVNRRFLLFFSLSPWEIWETAISVRWRESSGGAEKHRFENSTWALKNESRQFDFNVALRQNAEIK